jgi:23S rRNA (uridine2552-2'-O)-methyltransferase
VVGIDLLPTEPIEGVTIFEMDFMADEAPPRWKARSTGPPDLVLSDMAANTVGHKQTDHLRTMGLVETAVDFAINTLRRAGPSSPRSLPAAPTTTCSRSSSAISPP